MVLTEVIYMNIKYPIYTTGDENGKNCKIIDSYAAPRLLNFDSETQKKFDALLLKLKNRPEYPLLEYEIAWHRTPKYFLTDVLKAVEYILKILLKNLDNEMSYEDKTDIKSYWDSLVFEIWRKCK